MKSAVAFSMGALLGLAMGHQNVAKRALDIEKLRVGAKSTYVVTQAVQSEKTSLAARNNYTTVATQFVQSVTPNAEFRLVDDHYEGVGGLRHVYFKQTFHGIDVDNADFNVNVDTNGNIFSYGNSFYDGEKPEKHLLSQRRLLHPTTALHTVINQLGLPVKVENVTSQPVASPQNFIFTDTEGAASDPKAKLSYVVKNDSSLALTWRIEVDTMDDWLLIYVDAIRSDNIAGVISYGSSYASFEVYPWGVSDPAAGERKVLEDPWNLAASPYGWLSDGEKNYTTLHGNNAIAQAYPAGNASWEILEPESPSLEFNFEYSPTMIPSDDYRNASATQLFYTVNKYHDILYLLGFNEEAGNFQANNKGKGGKDGDSVLAISQYHLDTNNAAFFSPPDGTPGRLKMYMWNLSDPYRDGAFETYIVRHEYTHGLSSRLTGGPNNANCLESLEEQGMGEGWSDFMALATMVKSSASRYDDFLPAVWAPNEPNKGGRTYPYSTDMKVNPLLYSSLNKLKGVHDIGEFWCNMLFEVFWNIVDKHGIHASDEPKFDDKGVPTEGRFLTMKLVMGGMSLQPCHPTMTAARAAILDADKALTNGSNQCELWKGFAKRGFGAEASHKNGTFVDSFTVPANACP